MLFRKIVMSAMLVTVSSFAFADSGTPEEQDACRPDVRKFCSKVDPSAGDEGFLTCLENNRDKLSKKCLQVLIDHGR
jgi:hypothetical protein